MKVKEYPPSLARMLRLKTLNVRRLHERTDTLPLRVTLTSIPSRLNRVHYSVLSMLSQSRAPECIVLWLGEGDTELPDSLARLQGPRFEVRSGRDLGPYTKLIHALSAFPDEVLVTVDDDLMYDPRCLEVLWTEHEDHPGDIIAHECRRILADASGGAWLSYRQWGSAAPGSHQDNTLALGYSGVLYPPHSLPAEAQHEESFLALAPKADDLWWKAMSYRHGTTTRRAAVPVPKAWPVPASQKVSLRRSNVREDRNRSQWQALQSHYNLPVWTE